MKSNKNLFIILGISIILIALLIIIFSRGNAAGNAIKEVSSCGKGTTLYNGDRGLCWQTSVMPGDTKNWEHANSYCENLELAGKEDWRLPTLTELEKIVDKSQKDMVIDPLSFKDTQKKMYWTATPHINLENAHWYIKFDNGYEGYAFDFYSGYGARCVRTNSIF